MKLFRKKQPKQNSTKNIEPEIIKSIFTFSDKANEDNFQDSFFVSEEFKDYKIVIVADGIASSTFGDFASKQVTDVFRNFFVQINSFENPGTFLHRTVLVAATMLMNKAMMLPEYKDAKTSISGFVVHKNTLYTVNAGNCRVYHFSNGKLNQITKDQTIAQQQFDDKEVSEQEFFKGNYNEKITNFVSSSITSLNNEVSGPIEIKKGDFIFASTGGLHFTFKNEEIEQFIEKNKTKADIASVLGNVALNLKPNKNITVCSYVHQ